MSSGGNSWWNQIATPPVTKQSSGVGEQDYWSAQDRGVGASGGVVDTLPMAATLADLVEEDEGEDGYGIDHGGGGGPADDDYIQPVVDDGGGMRPRSGGDGFYASVGEENSVYSPNSMDRSGGGGYGEGVSADTSHYDNASSMQAAHYEAYGDGDGEDYGGGGDYGNAAAVNNTSAASFYDGPENENEYSNMEMEMGNTYATPYTQTQQQQQIQQMQEQGRAAQDPSADKYGYVVFNSGAGSQNPATAQRLPAAWTPASWNASAHLSMLPWVTVQRFPKKKEVELPPLIQKTTETSMQTDPPPTTVELEIQTDPSPSESVECQTIPMGTDFSAQTEQMGVDFWVQTDASAVLVDGSMQTHTEIQTQTYTEPVDMGTQTGVEDTDPDISVAFSALDEFGRRQHVKFESSVDTLNASMAQVAMGGRLGANPLLSSTGIGTNTSFGPNSSFGRSGNGSRFDDGRNGLNDTNGMDMANLSHMTSQLMPSLFMPAPAPPPPEPVSHTTQTDPPPNNVISIQTDPPPMVTSMAVQTDPMVLSDDPMATGSPRKPFRRMSSMVASVNGSGFGGGIPEESGYGNGDVGTNYASRGSSSGRPSSPVRRSSIRHGSRTSMSSSGSHGGGATLGSDLGSLGSPRAAWGANADALTDGGGPPSPRRRRSSSAANTSRASVTAPFSTSPAPPVFSSPKRSSRPAAHSVTSTPVPLPRAGMSHRPPRSGGGASTSLLTTREYSTTGIAETVGQRSYRRGTRGVASESVLRGLDEGPLDHSTNSSFGLFTAKSPGSSIRRY